MDIWMPTHWALPAEEARVCFTVNRRRVPMSGLFRDGHFQSRWWGYTPSEVDIWLPLRDTGDAACPATACSP